MVRVIENITKELEGKSVELHQKMNKVVEATVNVPSVMGNEFRKEMKALIKDMSYSLQQRDQVFLKSIDDHKKVVLELQKQNENSIKFLSNKVFDLSSNIYEFKHAMVERTDNSLALVHQ